jgi:hypothetical protein
MLTQPGGYYPGIEAASLAEVIALPLRGGVAGRLGAITAGVPGRGLPWTLAQLE